MRRKWKMLSDFVIRGLYRLARTPWTARRSNQLILKEINPEYSLEGLMLKLKLQYFGHLMWRSDSLEKNLMLGKIENRREWQRMRWLDGITDSMDMSLSKLWVCYSTWGCKESDTIEQLNNKRHAKIKIILLLYFLVYLIYWWLRRKKRKKHLFFFFPWNLQKGN